MNSLSMIGRDSALFCSDIATQENSLKNRVHESRILVIGGAGTIGHAVSKEIFKRDPKALHVVDISENSRPHYHKKMTEIYHVLEGRGTLELDNERLELKPGITVMIKPGCIHRAVGKLKLINVPIPTFDPADEWFPEEGTESA